MSRNVVNKFGRYRLLLPRPGLRPPGADDWMKVPVGKTVKKPKYAHSTRRTAEGFPNLCIHISPTIKTRKNIKDLQLSGKIARQVLDEVCNLVKPGMTTNEINNIGETLAVGGPSIMSND